MRSGTGPRTLILATSHAPELRAPEQRPAEYPRTDYVELAKTLDCDIIDYSVYDASRIRFRCARLEKMLRLDLHLAMLGYKRARGYDVVVLMSERVAIPYGLLTRAFGKRAETTMLSMHSSVRQARFMRRFGLGTTYAKVVSFTPAQEEFLTAEMGASSERISYVPYAVDEQFFRTSCGPDRGYVLTVGGVPGRDYATFVAALRDTGLPVKIVVGGRPYGRNTATPIYDLPAQFELYSSLTGCEMRELYQGAAVVVVPLAPQRADAAGSSVVLEGMCSGKPVVVSASPGIAPYIADGAPALLVEPGDPKAMRDAVEKLMGNPGLRADIGATARAFIDTEFGLDHYVKRLQDVIAGCPVQWPSMRTERVEVRSD